MDTRLELIDNLRISIEHEMKAVLEISGISMEEYQAVTQNYLLLKILEKLDSMSKTLNLISVQTSIMAIQVEKQNETDPS